MNEQQEQEQHSVSSAPPSRLDEIEARLGAATSGPWTATEIEDNWWTVAAPKKPNHHDIAILQNADMDDGANAELTALLRNSAEDLLAVARAAARNMPALKSAVVLLALHGAQGPANVVADILGACQQLEGHTPTHPPEQGQEGKP